MSKLRWIFTGGVRQQTFGPVVACEQCLFDMRLFAFKPGSWPVQACVFGFGKMALWNMLVCIQACLVFIQGLLAFVY